MIFSINQNIKITKKALSLAILGSLVFFNACSSEKVYEQETLPGVSAVKVQTVSELVANNPKVTVSKLKAKLVSQEIYCSGMVDLPPTELVFVHSRTAGFIRRLKYIPGDYVKKGALLALVENPKLIEEQRMLMETKAELDFAMNDFVRKQELLANNATSEKTYQEALSRKNKLTATYEGLKSELSLLGINIERLEQEKKYQSSIGVYATNAGFVHSVNVNMGQMIQPEVKLMEIANNGHMHLELNVLSRDAPFVKIGQKVQFRLPSGVKAYQAEVVKINPLIDTETNTMNVHCHIEDKKSPGIKPGVFTNATIFGDQHEQVGLPVNAVLKQGGGFFALRVVNGVVKKELLKNVSINNGWVTFDNNIEGEWVTTGAYYVDVDE